MTLQDTMAHEQYLHDGHRWRFSEDGNTASHAEAGVSLALNESSGIVTVTTTAQKRIDAMFAHRDPFCTSNGLTTGTWSVGRLEWDAKKLKIAKDRDAALNAAVDVMTAAGATGIKRFKGRRGKDESSVTGALADGAVTVVCNSHTGTVPHFTVRAEGAYAHGDTRGSAADGLADALRQLAASPGRFKVTKAAVPAMMEARNNLARLLPGGTAP